MNSETQTVRRDTFMPLILAKQKTWLPAMVLVQITAKGEGIIYVTDFYIPLLLRKERINLHILLFIKDLRDLGKLKIDLVTFDQYQSFNHPAISEREWIQL